MIKYKTVEEKIATEEELIKRGEGGGYLLISQDRSKITYRASGQSFNFENPKEKVRAYFLVKLIEKYKYAENKIKFDVEIPGHEITKSADLVVYQDMLSAYIVVECRKPGVKNSEIEKAEKEAIKKAVALKAKYAAIVIGSRLFVFEINGQPKSISDIPVNYGEPIES